ncbi:hypothetical protein SDC9_160336 [bioreactor metagenome]|uniref:Uncharacterized protein n=1 Tax=bioreactor metagenome TaxID=1076179 RepID=A0A645FH97_9ZZZZ
MILTGGDSMSGREKPKGSSVCLRLDPEERLCPKFDSVSIAKFRRAHWEEMGVNVVDDCAEEHIM